MSVVLFLPIFQLQNAELSYLVWLSPEAQLPQHDSLKKNRLVGAILGGKNVAESAHLIHMPYTTALNIWKKYKKTGSTHNLAHSSHPRTVTDHTK